MSSYRVISVAFVILTLPLAAKVIAQDTVVVHLANSSKVVLTIEDRKDLETLRQYDFQQLFEDLLEKVEENDTTPLVDIAEDTLSTSPEEEQWTIQYEDRDNRDDDDGDDWEWDWDQRIGRTTQSFNFDFGTNNYLSNGSFPDSENEPYSVRPWGSWYVAVNSIQRTRMGRNFFLEWGGGVSWYTFKFQEDNVLIEKDDSGVSFVLIDDPTIDFKKSKLTATYLNASLVPVIDFGGYGRKPRVWDGRNDSFRMGLGPYIGYRIESHSKIKYKQNDETEKDKNHDSFYLNTIRYGLRLQLGFRSTDVFFNYDLNNLFTDGKGPDLNAFSFGVIF